MAHAYIDAIANAGAYAVKFQTHIARAEDPVRLLEADGVFGMRMGAALEATIMRRPLIVLCVSDRVKDFGWWPLFGGGTYIYEADRIQTCKLTELLYDNE